jgi:hypothetical protein
MNKKVYLVNLPKYEADTVPLGPAIMQSVALACGFELPIKNFLQRYYATWQTYKPVDVEKEIANIDRFLEDL